MKASFAAFY